MADMCPVCRGVVTANDAACPSCGFKLLGMTQEFKPITLNGPVESGPSTASTTAVLKVVRGPQTGVSYALQNDEMTIGRSPRCSIFLNDMTVSRLHARIHREGTGYIITDEHSYNGVWVNNRNIEAKALSAGDFIQIGTFCLVYEEQSR